MAQSEARPEGREPPFGGLGYLSSLGLDDDDGLEAAMNDAAAEFGSHQTSPPGGAPGRAPGPPSGQGERLAHDRSTAYPPRDQHPPGPVDDGLGAGYVSSDPTAGWALPEQEDPGFLESPSAPHGVVHDGGYAPPVGEQPVDLVEHHPPYDAPAAPDPHQATPTHAYAREQHHPPQPEFGPHEFGHDFGPHDFGEQEFGRQQPEVPSGPEFTRGVPDEVRGFGESPQTEAPQALGLGDERVDIADDPGRVDPDTADGAGWAEWAQSADRPDGAHGVVDTADRLDQEWAYPPPGPPPPPDGRGAPDHEHVDPPPVAPAPHDARPADPWQDEWQPDAVGSLHPRLHDAAGGGRSIRRNAPPLTADTVLRRRAPRPQRGWRRAVYSVSGGKVNLGPSAAELREQELIQRARTPLSGCHRLAIISLKGGVGKTTTTAALGSVLATVRGDRCIAVDANPDRGTLAERIHAEHTSTVRGLLDAGDRVTRYADVRGYTSQATTRLEVLASDSDPGVSQAFSERDYRETITILERFYNLILTDCGTGLLHSAMRGILGLADSLVIVSSASLDGARSASATLDWLEVHGLADVVSRAVTVISTVRPDGGAVDVDRLEDHFAHRCRSVVTIPYDPHLEAGGVLELDELGSETRDAYYELAAEVGEGFS